jgi:hypothetical protein
VRGEIGDAGENIGKNACATLVGRKRKARPGNSRTGLGNYGAPESSGNVLSLVSGNDLSHLVLQVQLQLFQTMFLDFVLLGQMSLGFDGLELPVVFGMLFGKMAKGFVGSHQVRFEFVLIVDLHQAGLLWRCSRDCMFG